MAININEKYTEGINPNGINKSEINIAAIGNTNAKRLSFNLAEPNSAIAPMAVKLAGCGKKRVIAAIAINVATVNVDCIVNSFFMIFYSFSKIRKLNFN